MFNENHTKLPDNMLNDEDTQNIIDSTPNPDYIDHDYALVNTGNQVEDIFNS